MAEERKRREDEEPDEPLTGTAGTVLEGSQAGKGDDVVGTPGWAAASGAAESLRERGRGPPGQGRGGRRRRRVRPAGTPGYGTSGQEGQGADSADRPPGGSG